MGQQQMRVVHLQVNTRKHLLSTARKEVVLMAKTTKIGRDAGSGQFKSVKDAQRDPKHTVVETIKRPTKK